MRRNFVSTLMVATAVASFTGCSSYRIPSWNPFSSWSSAPATASTGPGSTDLSKSPAERNQSWLTSSWKSATDTVTAPFKSKEIKEDPVALATPSSPSPRFYVATGQLYESKGDAVGAIAQYEKALALDSNDLNGRISLARLYDRQGDVVKAVNEYQKAAGSHPNSGLVHNDLGLCYARHRQLPQAISEMEAAIRIDPASQMYRNNLATVLIEVRREDEAFEHLAAVNPPAVAHYNFGYLLHQRGRDELAVRELQTALTMDPSLGAASSLLAQLQPAGGMYAGGRNSIPVQPAAYPAGNPAQYQR